jgi:hypothetical protein
MLPLTIFYSARYINSVSVIDLAMLEEVSGSVIDVDLRTTGATFAELICADPEWLDAEFTALVSAGFGAPPTRPPAPPEVPDRRPRARQADRPGPVAIPATGGLRARARSLGRQRSPPAPLSEPAV